MGAKRLGLTAAAAAALLMLPGASRPTVLAQIKSGLWEITNHRGAPARRVCVAQGQLLAQVEHGSARCARTVLRDDSAVAIIEYNCGGRGFGHSELSILTPRSVRIDTQGIVDRAPFGYVAQARRLGKC